MTIAITADLHLTSRAEHPQRFTALEDILEQMLTVSADTLVIAGDLFDADRRDFHEFEEIISRQNFRSLKVVIIPGNHDAALKQSSFSQPNLLVFDKPQMVWLEKNGLPFLFLPYKTGISAGDQMAEFRGKIKPLEFILVSHGDFISGMRSPNPLERGIYMPLTRMDLESFQPARVFLGHTHIPYEQNRVISPGSPAAVDPTEIGRRGFWLYDSVANTMDRRFIRIGPIYMQEKFLVIPSNESAEHIQEEIRLRIAAWGFSENELKRVRLIARFSGCSPDRAFLREKVLQALDSITLYPNGEPDLSDVLSEDDPALAAAAGLALQKAIDLNLTSTPAIPELAEIQRAIFRLVYGE
ncbi:MAG: metallophosphoesterase [Leptolinea sp.]